MLFCGLSIGLTIFEHLSLFFSLLSFSLSLFLSFAVLDDTMATIGKRCRYLRELNLQSCAQLTDVACESIGQYCKQLRQLSLEGCGLITDEGAWQCWGCWLFLLFVVASLCGILLSNLLPCAHIYYSFFFISIALC